MQDVIALLTRAGIPLPEDLNLLAVALGLVLATFGWLIGWGTSLLAGNTLAGVWERLVGERHEGLGPRMLRVVRHGVAALLIAIILFSLDWWTYTDLILGAVGGASAGLFVWHVCRAVNFSRWIGIATGLAGFVIFLSNAVGGLERVSRVLDQVGVTIGDTRISLLTVFSFAVTALVLFAIFRIVRRIVKHSIQNVPGFDPAQRLLFDKIATVAIIVVAFFIGIDILGIDLTALAFFGGALGLAVGFGMQKTVGNLIAGIILLMDRSIKPGDVIEVGESFGWVNKIGVRAVSIITRDGKEHLIPNEILMTEEVINWSYSSLEVRVHIEVGVAYSTDLRLARDLLYDAAVESDRVLSSPKPQVRMLEFGESAVVFDIRIWITDPEGGVGNVRDDVLMRVWDKFKEHGVQIPFPQRDLHIRSWSEQAASELRGAGGLEELGKARETRPEG